MESFFADKQNEAILKKISLASYAININYDDYNSYCRRSVLYESLGLFKLSLDDAVKAISIDQTKDDGYIHQAKAFAGLKKYSEAERSLNDCLTITRSNRDLILSQLEHLRYLAVKQIGFDDQISSLASKRFGTINDSINGAFSMDLEDEEATKSDGQMNSANISSNLPVNSNPNGDLNSSSNSARNAIQFSVNNPMQGQAPSGQQSNGQQQQQHQQQQQNSSQINSIQTIQLNGGSSHIMSNQIGQLTNSQVNGQMNNGNSIRNQANSGHSTSQSNPLTSQLMSSDQQPIHSSQPFTNPNPFLSSTGGDKSLYTCANTLLSGSNNGSLAATIAITDNQQQHFLATSNQHLLNQHENPTSTVLDNTPLSEMDLQQDGTDFSSDMQMRTESEMQIRSDNSEQTLIIDSNRSLPQFTTPSKDFLSDLDNDFFLSSPFTNNNSSSSAGFGDSLTTPQFNRKDMSTRHQAKKQRVIKNLMNDLAEHSSPLYEHSPCPETSPFSNISSVQSINTPKSNVIVSPRQSPFKPPSNRMNDLDDLDDLNNLNNSINRPADGNVNSSRAEQEHRQHSPEEANKDQPNQAASTESGERDAEKNSTTSSSEEDKGEVVQYVTENSAGTHPVSNPQQFNGIIITGINSLNNLNNHLTGSAGGGVIKSSAPNTILVPHSLFQPQMQVNLSSLNKILLPTFQPPTPKVRPISTVASSIESQKITYPTNCLVTVQQQQQSNVEPFNIDKYFKEQNIVISSTAPSENGSPASVNTVSNPNSTNPPTNAQSRGNALSSSLAAPLGNFAPSKALSSDGSSHLPSNPANSASSPNNFNSTDLQSAQPIATIKLPTVAKPPRIVKPPILLSSKATNNENARSNCLNLLEQQNQTKGKESKFSKCLTRRKAIGDRIINLNSRTKTYKLSEKNDLEEENEEDANQK